MNSFSTDTLIALLFIGTLCGVGVSFLVHYHETDSAKIVGSIAAGILGAYVGATSLGKNFFVTSINGFSDAFFKTLKALSQILVSGVVLLPAFSCAVLFALAAALLLKVFMHSSHPHK